MLESENLVSLEELVALWPPGEFARHPKCVAIGECGLDFFKHPADKANKQLGAFRAQASLAVELGKALVVHARLVTKENEELFLREFGGLVPPEHAVHVHCFGDSLELAQALCDGWPNLRIGFTGKITFQDKGKGKCIYFSFCRNSSLARAAMQALQHCHRATFLKP